MISRKLIFLIIFVVAGLIVLFLLRPSSKETFPIASILVNDIEEILEIENITGIEKDPAITLEKIFDGINPDDDAQNWSLLVGGDVMIGRTVNYKTITYNNFDWPYVNLVELFSKSDFNFVNLESPVIVNCPIRNDGMIFCGSVNHITSLSKAGIDAVSLANNHMLNQGTDGLQTTINYLKQNNITAVGALNPSYVDIKGNRVALLAYTDIECYPGVECVESEKVKNEIASAKENSDLVVVMYHWGAEYRDYPTDRQIEFAHLSIDAGADLVLGNHPHWIQPFEIYKDKLIMYSHGNLVFDQMWSQKTREGVLVEYIFNKRNLIDVKIHPILIEDYGQPRLLENEAKLIKIDFIKEISENLANKNY